MAGKKTIIHLIIDTSELPNFENKVCAVIDVYENRNRTEESYRIDYNILTAGEQLLWNDFVNMIINKPKT